MKVLLNCSKPALYNTTLFKGEKAEVKAPAAKPATSSTELAKDTVEISKKPVETKADAKPEAKPEVAKVTKPVETKAVEVKAETAKVAKTAEVKAEVKTEVPVAKCEGDACKK